MTGELSLTGRVLPIGGVKEKVIAARRAGVTTILMPVDNRRDYDELPDYLKKGLTPHFATTFDDVLAVSFEGGPPVPSPAEVNSVSSPDESS